MGFFSASLNQIARSVEDLPSPSNLSNKLNWIDLSAGNTMVNAGNSLYYFIILSIYLK